MNLNEEINRMRVIMGLSENLQQAEKLYFKTGKLSDEVKNAILDITGGDNFTRLVSDLYYHFIKFNQNNEGVDNGTIKLCEMFHQYLKGYDKNLFPVPGILEDYGLGKESDKYHILTLFGTLKEREYLIKQWNKLPTLVKRNLVKPIKDELKIPFNSPDSNYLEYEYRKMGEQMKKTNDTITRLPKSTGESMLKKIFSSVKSFDDIVKTIDNVSKGLSFIGDDDALDKNELLDNLENYNADLILDKDNVIVVKANDVEAIQKLGCFSSWCFSQFGGEGYWDEYAPDGYVYVIIDFNKDVEDARFLMTYLPSTGDLYLSNNIPYEEAYPDGDQNEYINSIGIQRKYLI
jgi:hypothetical protein